MTLYSLSSNKEEYEIQNLDKIQAFQAVLEGALQDISNRTTPDDQRCIILSGGVDTCAILAAAEKLQISFHAAITVIIENVDDDVICQEDDHACPDRGFSKAAAQHYGLRHYIVRVTAQELMDTYLPSCTRALYTFDGMTLRNSLVVAAAFHKAAELGFKYAVVGDGADELLGGYSFMWGTEDQLPDEWKQKRNDMCRTWTFATAALAHMYNITSYSPYMEPNTVEWVLEHTAKSDCIGIRPIRLVHGGASLDHVTGKLLLRHAYDTVASWRRKDPIEVGSGITIIGHDEYWKDHLSEEDFITAQEQIRLKQGILIRSKEHLVNYRAFEAVFATSSMSEEEEPNEDNDNPRKSRFVPHPSTNKQFLPLGQGCVDCCFDIGDAKFCHICGAWPAQRNSIPTS